MLKEYIIVDIILLLNVCTKYKKAYSESLRNLSFILKIEAIRKVMKCAVSAYLNLVK